MRYVRLVALQALVATLIALVVHACKNEPRYAANSESAAVDRQRLCSEGGAAFHKDTNECECPFGATWDGIRCQAPADEATALKSPVPAGLPPHGGDAESPTEVDAETASASLEPTPAPADPDMLTRLKTACKRAKGLYVEKDQYCHCRDDKVLVARRCLTLNGSVTDDACLRAPSRGRWKKGVCSCEPGLIFSPARGGCVVASKGDTGDLTMLRRICESSLNKGKWDARDARCQCPAGRLWDDELCQVQGSLTSRRVCESDANRGRWSPAAKRCECPAGYVWIDQGCRRASAVTAQAACESEANGGRWDQGRSSCICPGLTRWRDGERLCAR